MNPEQEQKLDELYAFMQDMKAGTTVPREVELAFIDRFQLDTFSKLDASVKTAASETQAVDEAGSASYNVAKPMDGFRQVTIGGSTLYFPYYT